MRSEIYSLSYYFLIASFSFSLSPALNFSSELPSKFSALQSLSLFLLFFLFSLSISYIYLQARSPELSSS